MSSYHKEEEIKLMEELRAAFEEALDLNDIPTAYSYIQKVGDFSQEEAFLMQTELCDKLRLEKKLNATKSPYGLAY